jgi:hypothetical protein
MKAILASVMVVMCAALMGADGCDTPQSPPQSASGVSKANVQVPTGPDGLTIEQRNVRDRVTEDNKPGSIKHLYIISAYSGQTLLYSTVRGKVTSSGKRLTPNSIHVGGLASGSYNQGFGVNIGGGTYATGEVLQDDGTYGSSVEYLFWFDAKGIYHQHYPAGGQIIHVSSEPIAVKSVVINLEMDTKAPATSK